MSSRKNSRKEVTQRNRINLQRGLRMEYLEHRIVFAGVSPVAVNDLFHAVTDEPLEVASTGVLANDIDTETDVLGAVAYKGPSHGTLNLNSDGSFAYTPDAGFTGIDSFIYQADDGTSRSKLAAVTIQVSGPNAAPQTESDTYSIAEDGLLDVGSTHGLLSNDSDPEGDSLSATLVSGPQHGTLALDPDGSFVYQPDADYNGSDAFVYAVSDGVLSQEAPVELVVTSLNDAPTAFNDEYLIEEDGALVVSGPGVLANDLDVDAESVLTAVLSVGPEHGSLTLNDDGSFTYTPNVDFNGTDAFTYQASDGTSLSNLVVVEITVNAANDIPMAANDVYATDEGVELIVAGPGILVNDLDGDPETVLTAMLADGPEHGTLTLNEDGSFNYMPAENFNGTDAFTYQAFDGTSLSEVVVVEITVNSVNDAPIAANDVYATDEDTELIVSGPGVLGNDSDIDVETTLTALLADGPIHGTLTLNDDGSFTYVPEANFSGTDAFTYQVYDGESLSEVVVAEITISAVNDTPVALDDEFVTLENVAMNVPGPGVLGNDSDVDADTLLAAIVSAGPAHGTLTLGEDGGFVYTPDGDFVGTDSFSYMASDGELSVAALVSIVVQEANDQPLSANESYTVTLDSTLQVESLLGVLANDSDPNGDPLEAILFRGPIHGTLALNPDGSFLYTPNPGFEGVDAFIYRVTDGSLGSTLAVATLHVVAPPAESELALLVSDPSSHAVDAAIGDLTGMSSNEPLHENDLDTEFAVCDWSAFVPSLT